MPGGGFHQNVGFSLGPFFESFDNFEELWGGEKLRCACFSLCGLLE
jgi:hypothetical protein